MRLRSLTLAALVPALCLAILVPVALGDAAGVRMKLKGPGDAAYGSIIKLTATISNPERADGMRTATIMQNKDGHLVRIGSKAITWTDGGRKGTVTFSVKAGEATAMGVAWYRASWMHPEGTARSNVWRVEID